MMRSVLWIRRVAVVAGVLSGIAVMAQSPAPTAGPRLIGTFEGMLPCADCSGQRTRLSLYAARSETPTTGTFTLRATYVGTRDGDQVHESSGRWTLVTGTPEDPQASVYRLTFDTSEDEQFWLKVGDNELRTLDRQRRQIDSRLNLSLKRLAPSGPAPPAYRPATSADPGLRAAALFAVDQQNTRTPGLVLAAVTSAEYQMAAGTNYRLCLSVRNNGTREAAGALVFRDPRQQMTLKEWVWGACAATGK